MKKIILFLLLISAIGQAQETQAVLKGGLETAFISKKHLTTTERDAIVIESGKTYEIYNITTGQFETWNGTAWVVNNYEILVSTGNVDDVQAALDTAGTIPVRITADIPACTTPILLDSNQTLIFEGYTITVDATFTGDAVIKNANVSDSNTTVIGGTIVGTANNTVNYDAILFTAVDNGLIKNVKAVDVEIVAGTETGNLSLINCTNSTIDNCSATGTWRIGAYINGGSRNTINRGYYTLTNDSGIAVVNSPFAIIDGAYVDNCGLSDASNITIDMVDAIVRNCVSINASGVTNGNGITIGHEGAPATSGLVINNIFDDNISKGVFLQGTGTSNITIQNNIIGGNPSGVRITGGVSNIAIIDNTMANASNYNLNAGLVNITIHGNKAENKSNFVVRTPTAPTANVFSEAPIKFERNYQIANTWEGIAMPTSTTDLYGVSAGTERLTGGTDFEYSIRTHNNSDVGVKRFTIQDDGTIGFTNYSFPLADGTANQVLKTDGSGNLSFVSPQGTRLTASITGATNLDWNTDNTVFDYTLTGATTLANLNLPTGTATKVIELIVRGNFALTLPATWTALPGNDAYLGTGDNHIVVTCINGTTSSEIILYSLTNI